MWQTGWNRKGGDYTTEVVVTKVVGPNKTHLFRNVEPPHARRMVVGNPKLDENIAHGWLHPLLACRKGKPHELS